MKETGISVLARHDVMKILAVASDGGHWIELIRITKALEQDFKLCYAGTNRNQALSVSGNRFYRITDFSRTDCYKFVPVFFQALRIILKERPDAVITTGAAPGVVAVLVAALFRRKTVWIDSIANVNHLSLSGRIASRFVSRTYTQWEEPATGKIWFAGNVLG